MCVSLSLSLTLLLFRARALSLSLSLSYSYTPDNSDCLRSLRAFVLPIRTASLRSLEVCSLAPAAAGATLVSAAIAAATTLLPESVDALK